ncbi:MAG: hypothetical protein V1837_03125 [Candidatus Woesearchaeota archaeon]
MTDISKNTVLILLVLVIMSSVISTWAFITSVNIPKAPGQQTTNKQPTDIPTANAEIQLNIQPQPTTQAEINLEIRKP